MKLIENAKDSWGGTRVCPQAATTARPYGRLQHVMGIRWEPRHDPRWRLGRQTAPLGVRGSRPLDSDCRRSGGSTR